MAATSLSAGAQQAGDWVFADVPDGAHVYFCHSYHVEPARARRGQHAPEAVELQDGARGAEEVALAGDGAFLMTIGDLPTATEYGANVLCVVMNNSCFGQTTMQQQTIYGHVYGTLFQSPHFADMARACGAEGIRVSDPKHVEEALRQGLAATKRSFVADGVPASYWAPFVLHGS